MCVLEARRNENAKGPIVLAAECLGQDVVIAEHFTGTLLTREVDAINLLQIRGLRVSLSDFPEVTELVSGQRLKSDSRV